MTSLSLIEILNSNVEIVMNAIETHLMVGVRIQYVEHIAHSLEEVYLELIGDEQPQPGKAPGAGDTKQKTKRQEE
jgi:hypothetical protein